MESVVAIVAYYPNQKTITIRSSSGKKGRMHDPYGIITQKEFKIATHILDDPRNGTPLALYLALALNQNGYQFDFSPAEFEREYGIAADRWRNAIKVLITKG